MDALAGLLDMAQVLDLLCARVRPTLTECLAMDWPLLQAVLTRTPKLDDGIAGDVLLGMLGAGRR